MRHASFFCLPHVTPPFLVSSSRFLFFFRLQVVGGQDLMCKSRTGSGKTLAFAIPIIEALYRQVPYPCSQRSFKLYYTSVMVGSPSD